MGCDIHAFFEIKIKDSEQLDFPGIQRAHWHCYTQPRIARYYFMFERLAGVRGDVANAMFPPRGLPDDLSETVKFAARYMERDAHTHSWLNSKEIVDFNDWGEKYLECSPKNKYLFNGRWDMEIEWGCYLFGNSFAGFEKYPDARPKGLLDLRLVFWFDN